MEAASKIYFLTLLRSKQTFGNERSKLHNYWKANVKRASEKHLTGIAEMRNILQSLLTLTYISITRLPKNPNSVIGSIPKAFVLVWISTGESTSFKSNNKYALVY